MSLHRRRVHPDGPVEGCFGCRVSTLHISPAAMATRIESDRDYAFQQSFAAEFHNGDREAYRRLRANGVQPPSVRGSAVLERHADSRYEIETGHVAENPKALRAALRIAHDGGFDPLKPATTPKGE